MRQLSYADRSAILGIVEQLKAAAPIPDAEVLQRVSRFLLSHHDQAGFEHALTRDAVALCNHLRLSQDSAVQQAARAALRYLLEEQDFIADSEPIIGLQDDAYVLNLALHEIAGLTGVSVSYGAPSISDEEREAAETQLVRFVEQPYAPDTELIHAGRRFCQELRNLAETGYLGRMCRNVAWMADALETGTDCDSLAWIRGALSYLACPTDVIPNDLGIVGYLDDRYVIDTVVAMVRTEPDPWLSALDEVVGKWPFLNGVVLSEDGSRFSLSEFLLANAAVTIGQLNAPQNRRRAGLVLPLEGPLPFLLPFIAGLGVIYGLERDDGATLEFQPGQKVLVDGSSVAVFEGFEEIDGRQMFRMSQPKRHRGHSAHSSRLWPVKDLCRLRPADQSRSARGRIVHDLSRSPAPLGAVDRLLHTQRPIQFSGVPHHLLCVTRVTRARDWLSRLRLYGERLIDVFPIGGVTADGDVELWSDRWKGASPLLLFASSLDRASELLDEMEDNTTAMVTVDGRGEIARQGVSLRRLCRTDIPFLAIVRERDHQDLELLASEQFKLLEWEPTDVRELLWTGPQSDINGHTLRRYESRVVDFGAATVEARYIECPEASAACDALADLRRLQATRDDEIDDLASFLLRARRLIHRLSQTLVSTSLRGQALGQVESDLIALSNIASSSLFMSNAERSGAQRVLAALEAFKVRLECDNPKAAAVSELLGAHARVVVICRDTVSACEAAACWANAEHSPQVDVRSCPITVDLPSDQPAVVCGWFGRQRMPALLHPPITRSVILLLYQHEHNWYRAYERFHAQARRRRAGPEDRDLLLGTKSRWRGQDNQYRQKQDENLGNDSAVERTVWDELDELELAHRRNSAIQRASTGSWDEPDIDARLVWFTEDSHAFLSANYRAKVVTHLIEHSITGTAAEGADVKTVPVTEVGVGDYLLFHLGSDADAIRAVADKMPGIAEKRRLARTWQGALRRFRERHTLSTRQIWQRLRERGCEHHLLTVRNWIEDDDMIAPRDAHDHELRIIADVTDDEALKRSMHDCDEAIRDVWGAHLSASHHLAKRVLERCTRVLASAENALSAGVVEVDPSVVVARVAEIDPAPLSVKRSMANRLLDDSDD